VTSIDEAWLRVFVDDDFEHRRPPSGEWEQVTTAHEAIALLETGRVIELSLDHDLGDEEEASRASTSSHGWPNSRSCTGASCGRATGSRSTLRTRSAATTSCGLSGTRPGDD
jgi:hypothetical protein